MKVSLIRNYVISINVVEIVGIWKRNVSINCIHTVLFVIYVNAAVVDVSQNRVHAAVTAELI